MKPRMILAICAVLMLVLVMGCAKQQRGMPAGADDVLSDDEYDACTSDEDCICKGILPERKTCYIGNKEYYDLYVDKRTDCPAPDFCTGPEDNLVIKCLGGRCIQMPECSFDLECGEGGRCVKNKCV